LKSQAPTGWLVEDGSLKSTDNIGEATSFYVDKCPQDPAEYIIRIGHRYGESLFYSVGDWVQSSYSGSCKKEGYLFNIDPQEMSLDE